MAVVQAQLDSLSEEGHEAFQVLYTVEGELTDERRPTVLRGGPPYKLFARPHHLSLLTHLGSLKYSLGSLEDGE